MFFYLLIVIAAYSVFHMYRLSRRAQIHVGVMIAIIGLLIAAQHAIAPFETLFTNSVNAFQNSVVHGLSFTDEYFNIPRSEEHTSELQSRGQIVCRLLLEKQAINKIK